MFLSLASYSRIEVASGTVAPDKGVAALIPPRAGVVTDVAVREGQMVNAGTVLLQVKAEEDLASGSSAAGQITAALAQQDRNISTQINAGGAASAAQTAENVARQNGLRAEIASLGNQIALQRSLVTSAKNDFDRASEIAKGGFVSGRDLQVRQDAWLTRRQQLAQLEQSVSIRQSSLIESERSSTQLLAQAAAQIANLESTRAGIAQQAASTQGGRAYALRAPISGKVSSLTARVGQPANPQQSVLTIVPSDAKLRAELYIATTAIGFVKPGQEVRIAIDAFPYQRFGTIKGRVAQVAISATGRPGENGTVTPSYLVVVNLEKAEVTAFGTQQPLLPGMTLNPSYSLAG